MTSAATIAPVLAVPSADDLDVLLHERFGHASFRPQQRAIVETVLSGRDTLAVMPTGSGKSLCYQLPALLTSRPTVVVSPLIALMKDQVDALDARGIEAAALHSNMTAAEQQRAGARYLGGRLRLLYVAPERLVREDMRALLRAMPPARMVVDEAHCISEWGHDFRRDYLRIGEALSGLEGVQVVACTATATPDVREDIAERLHMRDAAVLVHGFERTNLRLEVERCTGENAKLARLDDLVDPGDGQVLVYAGTRTRAAALAARLSGRFPTMLYHGDLGAEERAEAHERFARGDVRVAVTTSAFGMGVDVPGIRTVVHVTLPGSLEEYYQQAGRAGRDGLPARCILLHAPGDQRLQHFFIEASHPTPQTVALVYRALRDHGRDPGDWRLVAPADPDAARLSVAAANAVRALLRESGVIDRDGAVADLPVDHLRVDHGRVARHRRLAYRRLDSILTYVSRRRCRHRVILEHFGEPASDCGDRCDACSGAGAAARPVDTDTVQRALSVVARLNGRFGIAKLSGVLAGSRSKAVTDIAGIATLPTYGALRGWREADIAELLRRLVDAGAITVAAPPYPTASLTRFGIEVMRGDAALDVADPRSGGGAAPRAGADADLDAAAAALFDRLRTWRTEQARERGVPPYIVFHDRTLRAVAAARPRDAAALLDVPGVGPGKAALYGASMLAVVADASP